MLRRVALPPDLLTAATGAFLTLASIMAVGRYGAGKGLGLTIGGCVFLVLVSCFVLLPHVSVAGSIFYFAMLPTLKVFGSELLGGTKDVIAFAAASAALVLVVQRRAGRAPVRIDRGVLALLALVALLYLFDIGGNLSGQSRYGLAWFHGIRLFAEPISLHLVGLCLRDPRRNHLKRHLLIDILVITLCAVICGANDWQQVVTFGRRRRAWLATSFCSNGDTHSFLTGCQGPRISALPFFSDKWYCKCHEE